MSIVRSLIRFINWLFPKNKKHVYFRSTSLFPDNINSVLDRLLLEKNDLKFFCDGLSFSHINDRRVKVVNNKLKSFFYFITSKYAIFDTGLFGNPKAIKKQVTVNIWHGVGFKKIGFYLNEKQKPYPTCTYAVTYSPLFRDVVANAFGIEAKNVLLTGEPRNDYLFKPCSDCTMYNLGLDFANKKIVFWMPTYRHSKFENKSDGAEYDLGFPFINMRNLTQIDDFCSKKNIQLVLKWHGLQIIPNEVFLAKLGNVSFLTTDDICREKVSFYSVLARADALITDYSSAFINFMILDKPICFAYDDLLFYKNKRGFMFDNIEALMPGVHANSFEELKDFLSQVSVGEDTTKKIRDKEKNSFNTWCDNKNCDRLLSFLGLLEEQDEKK